jgi:hypothetical protein
MSEEAKLRRSKVLGPMTPRTMVEGQNSSVEQTVVDRPWLPADFFSVWCSFCS